MLERFNPCQAARKDNKIDLDDRSSPAAILAKVILSVSIVQMWQREDWKTEDMDDGSYAPRLPYSPLEEILRDAERTVYVG